MKKPKRQDVAHWENALVHWGFYVRQGKTFPNKLGYPPASVEARLMAGETGGTPVRQAKVPIRFNMDDEVEKLDVIMTRKMPCHLFSVVLLKYVVGMSQRDIATCEQISRAETSKRCWQAVAWVHGAMSE